MTRGIVALLLALCLASGAEAVNVEAYGATGTDATADTAAIQAAIDAAFLDMSAAIGGTVYIPAGVYIITDTLMVQNPSIHLVGDGKGATVLSCQLTTPNTPCVHFTTGVNAVLYRASIRGLSIGNWGPTLGTIGIQATDTSELVIEDVDLLMATTGATVGLKLKGREFTTLNRVESRAVQPLVLADNPNNTLDSDHLHVQDFTGLAPPGSDVVTIEDGVNVTNLLFDGYQGWVGGRDGLRWISDKPFADLNIVFRHVRREQDAGGYAFRIHRTIGQVRGLVIDDFQGTSGGDGIFLRTVRGVTIRDSLYLRAGGVSLDADASCRSITLAMYYQEFGSVKVIGPGLIPIRQLGHAQVGTLTDIFTVYDVPLYSGWQTGP